MRILIFANPIAGAGRGQTIADRLKQRLTRRGFDVRLFFDRAEKIDPAEIDQPTLAAISIGGDGTLRTVAAFLIEHLPPERLPPLVVVPLGTANLMRQHLGLDWDARKVERAIHRQKIVYLDAARANGELFLLIAGVGIDAAIVHALDRIRQGPINKLSYVMPSLLVLRDYRFPSMSVEVDGKLVFPMAPAMAFVGNVPEYGTGFPILPNAKSDDGLLDICVLPCRTPQQLVEIALRTAASEHMQMPGVVCLKGARIRVQTEEAVPVQLDGDAAGHTPLEIELLPYRLPFIVP